MYEFKTNSDGTITLINPTNGSVVGNIPNKIIQRAAAPEGAQSIQEAELLNPPTAGRKTLGAGLMVQESPRGAERKTRAQMLLEDLEDVAEIKAVKISGKEFFIQRLDFEGITLVGLLTPRDKDQKLRLGKKGVMRALQTAMLFVCLVRSATDDRPLFEDYADAYAFATSKRKGAPMLNGDLFEAMLDLNPECAEELTEEDDGEPKNAEGPETT